MVTEVAPVSEDASAVSAPAPAPKRRGRGGSKRPAKEQAQQADPLPEPPVQSEPTVPALTEAVDAPSENKPAARSRRGRKPKAAADGGEQSA